MKIAALLGAVLVLASCTTPETTRRVSPDLSLPPMKTFASTLPTPPRMSNAIISRDFLDLVFQLENGQEIPVFSRFEGPIAVGISGQAPALLSNDLDRLLARLRSEAGLDIFRAKTAETASISVVPVTRSQIQRVAPTAACFVRPNVSSWQEYRSRKNDPNTAWNQLRERRKMAVFLPTDVSPQEMRDCLHEEIAQALGPVNDLYRLSESIFNDDNFHTVLTGYDMLILRAYYDPALRTGMSRGEVAARLPAILNRLNPGGRSSSVAFVPQISSAWKAAINSATTPRLSKSRRRAAALQAVELARAAGPSDTRLAFSYYVLGRLTLSVDPDRALNAFLEAGRVYQNRPDTAVQEAHVALQVAAFQLSANRPSAAIRIVDRNLNVVKQSQHAALLSLLLMVKAEALEVQGRAAEAREVQAEALAWARYGFGDENEIRNRSAEILAISPRMRQGTPT